MKKHSEFKQVRAIDVKPYRWALWCSIKGGEPFANPIVYRRWSEDGERIIFALDSNNGYSAKPDDILELIPYENDWAEANWERLEERDATRMKHRYPQGKCPTCGQDRKREEDPFAPLGDI